jgi:hypothetical protein
VWSLANIRSESEIFGFGLELLGDGPLIRVLGLFVLELCFIKALTIFVVSH